MLLRSVRMKRFIFGFQRRVWCPKCTPLSRSWRIVTTAMPLSSLVGFSVVPSDRHSQLVGWPATLCRPLARVLSYAAEGGPRRLGAVCLAAGRLPDTRSQPKGTPAAGESLPGRGVEISHCAYLT